MWLGDFAPISERVRELYPDLMLGCRDVSWEEVSSRLVESSQRIQIKVINGAARDALDYWDHPEGLSAIAIGGDKLSRGLTLEGLSVSYYLRASRMYDTLLQMGRWFGYRPGYVDLCRLYTTDELRDFYSHITMAAEELRQEFDLMADRGMTPSDFGLRVRSHPAGLVITAANKMRNGTPMTVSYSGDITETISFDRAPGGQPEKSRTVRSIHPVLGSAGSAGHGTGDNRVWRAVAGERVADLLEEITVHQGSRKRGETISPGTSGPRMPWGAWSIGPCPSYPIRRESRRWPRSWGLDGASGSESPPSHGQPGRGQRVPHPPPGQSNGRDDRPDGRPAGRGRAIRPCGNILTTRRPADIAMCQRDPVGPASVASGATGTGCC